MRKKKDLVPKCKGGTGDRNYSSQHILYWRRKKVGQEIFLRVSELCSDSLIKKPVNIVRRKIVKIVKTIMKTGKLITIATVEVKAESPATVCWVGFILPRDPA